MNQLAIERNHQALKRLLAILFVYIGLADDTGDAMRERPPGPGLEGAPRADDDFEPPPSHDPRAAASG